MELGGMLTTFDVPLLHVSCEDDGSRPSSSLICVYRTLIRLRWWWREMKLRLHVSYLFLGKC